MSNHDNQCTTCGQDGHRAHECPLAGKYLPREWVTRQQLLAIAIVCIAASMVAFAKGW